MAECHWRGAESLIREIQDGVQHGYLGISFAVVKDKVMAVYNSPRCLLRK